MFTCQNVQSIRSSFPSVVVCFVWFYFWLICYKLLDSFSFASFLATLGCSVFFVASTFRYKNWELNYVEFCRAHEKTTIFLQGITLNVMPNVRFARPKPHKYWREIHTRSTSSPDSMLNTGFTSARTLAMLHHISPYLHQFGSRMQHGNAVFFSVRCLRFSLHHKRHKKKKQKWFIDKTKRIVFFFFVYFICAFLQKKRRKTTHFCDQNATRFRCFI